MSRTDPRVTHDFLNALQRISIPISRTHFPESIAQELVGVQPMSTPLTRSNPFSVRFRYKRQRRTKINGHAFIHIQNLKTGLIYIYEGQFINRSEMCADAIEFLMKRGIWDGVYDNWEIAWYRIQGAMATSITEMNNKMRIIPDWKPLKSLILNG